MIAEMLQQPLYLDPQKGPWAFLITLVIGAATTYGALELMDRA